MRPLSLAFFALLLLPCLAFAQKADPYAGKPNWYRPGHPLDPAEPAAIMTLPGFEVEKLLGIPKEVGSLTTMAIDPEGRLIVATQHERGLYRVTPSAIGSGEPSKLEPMKGEAAAIGWSQGLLHAFGSLYVTVAEDSPTHPPGVYRLRDTSGDGTFDKRVQLLSLRAKGEHAAHNMVAGPDGRSIYLMCGNGTPVPKTIRQRKTVRTEGLDHLMPPGFHSTEFTDGGWVVRFDPDGGNPELIAGGLRNCYDHAFNDRGDLFTFDADMEYDLGTPWYRPTRICHVVSGGEFGWRAGAGKWPEHYPDSLQPVVNIGPSSPTGVLFGYEAAFPEKYRRALYALDWTFAMIYAVHLEPRGAGYTATFEEFASGTGLPLTDAVIGGDGALYFCVGGRKLGSAIYRIWYSGDESTSGSPATTRTPSPGVARELRLKLEAFHGREDPKALAAIRPHLGSADPMLRFAARIGLESQPVAEWRERAMSEEGLSSKLTALLALARQGEKEDLPRVIDALGNIDLTKLEEKPLLDFLRVFELALARGGPTLKEPGLAFSREIRKLLPHTSELVNRELARVLCYLGDESVIDPLLDLMEKDKGKSVTEGSGLVERNLVYGAAVLAMMRAAPMVERMHHAQMLNWQRSGWTPARRKRYFQLIVEAMLTSKGGVGYGSSWEQIFEVAKAALPETEKATLAPVWAVLEEAPPVPRAKGPGKLWEMEYLLKRLENGFGARDFRNGEKMFAAATCVTCHSMNGQGGISGPDLTGVGQRFTIRDLIDSIVHPNNAISDQYQLMILAMKNGDSLTGRVHSRDADKTTLAPNVLKPNLTRSIRNADIASITPLPVSTMPPGLLNTLNEEEVLDLIAYLAGGGDPEHPLFKPARKRAE